eukprot:TRINITY_DN2839_c0_g1_i3.p1 TRINITY_DN2839_c0_g1~~TRINITY_DN2839_c0_g1_i3.p1  ORF type:complete len:414 (+),score=26.53 TRINITY_DN2839_c0_g1_i3:42-1283(+)
MADQEARIEQLLTTMQAAILSSNQMQATLVASLEAQERANSQRFANMDQTVQRIRVTNANARPMPAVQTQKDEKAAEAAEDDDEEILLLEHPVKAIRANPKPCIMAAGMAVVSLIAIVVTSVVGISRAYGDIIIPFYLAWSFGTTFVIGGTFMLYIRQQRIAKWSRYRLMEGLLYGCLLIILPLVVVLVDFEAICASTNCNLSAARISVDTSSAIPAGEVFRFPISSVPCCRSMRINSFHPSDVASFDNTTNEVVGIMPQNSTAVACTAICPIFGTDNTINCQTFWLIASRNGTRVPSTALIRDEAQVILFLVGILYMVTTICSGHVLNEMISRARRLTASLVALMVAVMMTCTCFVVVGSCGLIPFIPVYVVLPVAAALQLVVCVVMIRQKTRDTSWAFLGLAVKKAEDDDL